MTVQDKKDLCLVALVIMMTFYVGMRFGETRDQNLPMNMNGGPGVSGSMPPGMVPQLQAPANSLVIPDGSLPLTVPAGATPVPRGGQ